tara:strand:- start:1560 stop:2117 length:558 start_codon:yes stop_codon:yes gene_type:complete
MDMVFIDPQHSKCEILDIIKHSNMDITQPYLYTKDSLFELLISYLMNSKCDITFYNPQYPFNDKKEFIEWLGKAPVKLSCADKLSITNTAREIISYCKSGYDFNKTKYKTYEEVENEVLKIKPHGTISYVRTAIKLFNLTRDVNNQIECKIPTYIHNQIMLRSHYKKKCRPTLQIRYGTFKIDFS